MAGLSDILDKVRGTSTPPDDEDEAAAIKKKSENFQKQYGSTPVSGDLPEEGLKEGDLKVFKPFGDYLQEKEKDTNKGFLLGDPEAQKYMHMEPAVPMGTVGMVGGAAKAAPFLESQAATAKGDAAASGAVARLAGKGIPARPAISSGAFQAAKANPELLESMGANSARAEGQYQAQQQAMKEGAATAKSSPVRSNPTGGNTLDYSKMGKAPPTESPALDYSKMRSPAPPEGSAPAAASVPPGGYDRNLVARLQKQYQDSASLGTYEGDQAAKGYLTELQKVRGGYK